VNSLKEIPMCRKEVDEAVNICMKLLHPKLPFAHLFLITIAGIAAVIAIPLTLPALLMQLASVLGSMFPITLLVGLAMVCVAEYATLLRRLL